MTLTEQRAQRGPEHSDPLIPLFVYGTLREGQGNFAWMADAVKYVTKDCTTEGRVYFVSGSQGYPVAKFDEEGRITGDILWCDPSHPDYEATVNMETHAGYVLQEIEVLTDDGVQESFGFHYRGTPRGALIQSGDWAKEYAESW